MIVGAAVAANVAGLGDAESFAILTGLVAAFWATRNGRAPCGGC